MFKKNVLPILFVITILVSLFPTSNRVHATGEPNLALNKTVTAAAFQYGYLPSVVDGIHAYGADTTRWSSYGSNNLTDYLDIDFGSAVSFNQVKLYLFNDGGGVLPPAGYNIQYWNGSIWVDALDQIKTPTNPGATKNTEGPTAGNTLNIANFVTVTSQKLRVVFTNKNIAINAYTGVVELEVFLVQTTDEIAGLTIVTQIGTLPSLANVVLMDKTNIAAARAAYEALTESQKVFVSNLDILTAAEAAIVTLEADRSAALAVTTQIEALPSQANVALTDKTDIFAARAAYNNLTGSQKILVNNLSRLTDAEERIVILEVEQATDESAANMVEEQIEGLPQQVDVALSDKLAIEIARSAYNMLTSSQQELVNNYSILTNAESAIEALEASLTEIHIQTAFSNAEGNRITLKLPSNLDTEYIMQVNYYKVTLNGDPVTVEDAEYDSTDYSDKTIILTLSAPVLHNETLVTVSLQNGAFRTNNNELNMEIDSRPVTTFRNLDLSLDNLIGVDDVVQMISNDVSQIDINQDGIFNREDIHLILGQISKYKINVIE